MFIATVLTTVAGEADDAPILEASLSSQLAVIEASSALTGLTADNPLAINFPLPAGFSIASEGTTIAGQFCVYWDTETLTWSTKGCKATVSNGTATCECTHLTSFTLAKYEIPTVIPPDILDVVTVMGIIISGKPLYIPLLPLPLTPT